MTEKKILTQEMMDSGNNWKELGFDMRQDRLTWEECEECAMELVSRTTVPDDDGVFYWSYRKILEETFYKVKYLTSVDTDNWETDEGRVAVVNFAFKSGLYDDLGDCFGTGWEIVEDTAFDLFNALKVKHEHTSSPLHKIGKTFESILGDKDIIKSIAESREVSEKMIEMVGIYRDAKEKEKPAGGLPLNMFAKK